jgi:hypothetical protein
MSQSGAQPILRELAKYPQLDPRAVLAIASHEGLGGGIGDQGTSFGFAQLHKGGAYPSWAPQNPQAAQEWAWSPQGIDYALRQMASVAGGLKGAPAISAISTRFERPANPQAEIADALAHYGAPLPAGGALPASAPRPLGPPSAAAGSSGPNPLLALLANAIGQTNQSVGLGGSPGIAQLLLSRMGR